MQESSCIENKWVPRKEILVPISPRKIFALGWAISDLTNRKFIIKHPDNQGEYKMYSKMFQVYISKILPA